MELLRKADHHGDDTGAEMFTDLSYDTEDC